MTKSPIILLALALAGCVSSPDPKSPFKTKVDGWVEKGDLQVAVADERPIPPPAKTYDTGPLGLPAPFGLTPEHLADEYVRLDAKYRITESVLPEPLAASVKRMLPPGPLPVGVERQPHGAVVRVEAAGRSFEVVTDESGHARLPLAAIAVATLEQGDEQTKVALDVADGGKGELVLVRNDLIDIADSAPRLPDYGLAELPPGGAFWSVVAARAATRRLHDEATRRATLQLDSATAKLLVDGTGTAELPDGARVDWSPAPPIDAGANDPAASPRPNPRIEVSLERGDRDALVFIVKVTNEGEGALHQLRARTRSNVRAAEDVLLLLGRIGPGESVERRFEVSSPRALRRNDVTLELDFWEARGQAPPPVEARFPAARR